MSNRSMSQHEMDRRKIMAAAQSAVTDVFQKITEQTGGLTPLEWCYVYCRLMDQMNGVGLQDEWEDEANAEANSAETY